MSDDKKSSENLMNSEFYDDYLTKNFNSIQEISTFDKNIRINQKINNKKINQAMKKITNLKKGILSILMVMVISGTMSFVYGQTVTPAYHEECEYFIGTLSFSIRLGKLESYQWYTAPYRTSDWVVIPGATSHILSMTFSKLNPYTSKEFNRRQFRCLITPTLSKPYYSDIAYTYVLTKPSVTAHPVGATKYVGESITLSISSSGSTPKYYQWQLDKGSGYSDISGATSTSYSISTVTMDDAGTYRCVVNNNCGTAYSAGATLTVLEPLFGEGWFTQTSGTSKDIRQISALSEYNAWAVTNETDLLLHTVDGGESWNSIYMVDASANPLNYYSNYCIWFTNSNNGYVGGYNGYAYTTNGGTIWAKKDVKTAIGIGVSDYFYTNDMFFYNTSIGWIVGTDGLIAYTSDGGTTWTKQNWSKDPGKVTDADLKSVYFIDNLNGWIGGANGVILRTTNGGSTWVLQSAPETYTIQDIHFVSATKGFAVGSTYGGIYSTENGGSTWVKYSGSLPSVYPYAIDFVNENNGWIAGYGYKGGVYGATILRTIDGGNNWYMQTVENPNTLYLYHIVMVDIDNGWAVGKAGTARRTAFGGCLHPTMNLFDDISSCASDPYTIIADTFKKNDNVFYLWNTGSTNGRITVTETGEYSVVVTNLCGETATDAKQVIFYPLPDAYAGEDVSICPGDTTQLLASGGETYSWNYEWTLSDPIIQNPRAFPTSTTYYTVSVTDSNGCVDYDEVIVSVQYPYEGEDICLVSVDPETEKNMVIWEKTLGAGIESYNIYRESSTADVYELIGNIPFDNLSVFIDVNSQPEVKQYKYKISVVDTCGNESSKSPYHKTMLLVSNLGPTSINLSWTEYTVESGGFGFVKYLIYRGDAPGNLALIDSIASDNTSYPDYDPPASRMYYRIAGVKATKCYPSVTTGKKAGTGPYSQSMSNLEDNRLQTGIQDLRDGTYNLKIYPNPFRQQTRITYRLDKTSDVKIEVFNLLGARTADIVNAKQNPGDFSYDLNASDMGVAEGVFYLRFTVNGNTTVKKLILTK